MCPPPSEPHTGISQLTCTALPLIGTNSFQRVRDYITGVCRAGWHSGSRAQTTLLRSSVPRFWAISISDVCHSASDGQLGLQSALLEGGREGGQCRLPGWLLEQGDEHPERAALGWL